MRRLLLLAVVMPAVLASEPARAAGGIKVVTSTEDLAALAREVGGDRVSVEALGKGYQDPHFVDAKPSFILKLHEADLLILVGRELELGWLPPLITQSRNAKIQPGGTGYLDASLNVKILDIPTGQITRAMGDVHAQGNPHYWLDPDNGRRIAQAIQQKLTGISPADGPHFAERYADFDKRLAAATTRWDAAMAPYRGAKLVTYHRSWPNFAARFGLDVIGYIEPKPGIAPSPSHTIEVMQAIRQQNVKVILVEPYFDLKTPNAIARDTGAKVLVMPPSVGGVKEAASYIALFDYDIALLTSALGPAGAK